MKKNTKVLLTQKWWKDNKAKTLIGKGNLGKTLGAFESAFKLAIVAKGAERAKRLKTAISLCDALDEAAKKNAKACNSKIHADTLHVLKTSFPAEVDKHRKVLQKALKTMKQELTSLKVSDLLKDKTMLVLYMQMAKKNFTIENINFILAAKKKNAAVYDEFIKEYASQQINIDYDLRVEFDNAFRDGKLGSAPWSKAVNVCASLIMTNDLGAKFTKHVMGE